MSVETVDKVDLSTKPRDDGGVTDRPHRETADLSGALRRMTDALVKRAAGGDLDAIEELAANERYISEAIGRAALAAHGYGYSWTDIGETLGTSRQAARQRFGRG